MAQAKPCWSWTGVAELASSGRDAHLRDLVALLPVKKSSDEQIVDHLADLRDRFHRRLSLAPAANSKPRPCAR